MLHLPASYFSFSPLLLPVAVAVAGAFHPTPSLPPSPSTLPLPSPLLRSLPNWASSLLPVAASVREEASLSSRPADRGRELPAPPAPRRLGRFPAAGSLSRGGVSVADELLRLLRVGGAGRGGQEAPRRQGRPAGSRGGTRRIRYATAARPRPGSRTRPSLPRSALLFRLV